MEQRLMSIQSKKIKDMTLVAACAAILFAQQVMLSFLPNIQFTTLLVILYTKVLGFKRTTLIVVIHVVVIAFLSPAGSINPIHLPAMLIGWMLIPILLSTFLKHLNHAFGLSIFGLIFGFVYGWIFIPFSVFLLDAPFLEYFMMDLPFEIMMAISNFITILWLYDILKKVLTDLINTYTQKDIVQKP
jgi:energy-coupling factor transport system substrate-specific component